MSRDGFLRPVVIHVHKVAIMIYMLVLEDIAACMKQSLAALQVDLTSWQRILRNSAEAKWPRMTWLRKPMLDVMI